MIKKIMEVYNMVDENNNNGIDFSQLISALTNKFERLSNKSSVITDTVETGDDVKYTTIVAVRNWVNGKLSGKQDTLESGVNIKTVNNNSLVGAGNIVIEEYELPTASASTLGGVKIGTNININAQGVISATDTTYNDATTSVHGLMSTTDKGKLDSITVANLESTLNKKTSISSSSTDTEYPSAKAVYTAISSAISGVTQFDYEVVTALPTTGVKGKIYLVANSGSTGNIYDEYIWIVVSGSGKFEKIGTTQIDLSNYFTKSETNSAIDGKVSAHNSSGSAHSSLFASKLEESDLQDAFDSLADAIDEL